MATFCARSSRLVRAAMTMSTLPVSSSGMRFAFVVDTYSISAPREAASACAASMSKPSYSPELFMTP